MRVPCDVKIGAGRDCYYSCTYCDVYLISFGDILTALYGSQNTYQNLYICAEESSNFNLNVSKVLTKTRLLSHLQ